MRTLHWIAAALICAVLMPACANPPKVTQGTVVSYSPDSDTLVVKDELAPHREIAFSLAGAEIGATPEAEDVVRVAYREKGDTAVAIRVMNLTKQEELSREKR